MTTQPIWQALFNNPSGNLILDTFKNMQGIPIAGEPEKRIVIDFGWVEVNPFKEGVVCISCKGIVQNP